MCTTKSFSEGQEMKGFFNKLMRIDLTERSYRYENIDDSLLRRTLGGKGLGVHLLLEENPVGVDPFSPENRFILVTGPITGTKVWSQSRYAAFSKSPATGGYGESYCGGSLAPKIKGCGIDAVIISGSASSPLFLTMDENGVLFHDATPIWGAETYDAEEYILGRSEQGAGAMVIGPAGENLAVQACIKSDRWRSLGRGGFGAVLGSKKIKGISFSGKLQADTADKDLLSEVIKRIARTHKDSPVTAKYQKFGTISQVAVTNAANCFPTRYWESGHFEKWESLSADYMHEHFEVSKHGCPSCFLQCTKQGVVKSGRHAGLKVEGPEFETVYAIGGLNCIENLEEVAWLNDICDRLGLDTMSAGNLAALAVVAWKKGRIDFEIDYNQPDRVAEFFRLLAAAEGAGAIFARGIRAAARELDLEDIAVHVKGLEPAGFDPRVLKGMGLSYATAARGACHLRGTFYKAELTGEVDPETIRGKAVYHIDYEDRAALFDSLILCRFFRDFYLWDEIADLIRGSTGLEFSKRELEVLANRITQQTREYNRREGLGPELDTLPRRFFRETTEEGAVLAEDDLNMMIDEYNQIRKERYEEAAVID
jgi:aldehyde:ferredoxin oxidoreductase